MASATLTCSGIILVSMTVVITIAAHGLDGVPSGEVADVLHRAREGLEDGLAPNINTSNTGNININSNQLES